MRVEYPIALDSDYGVWNAFGNRYWPAVYLADAEGRIRYHHREGEYDDGEWMIQHLRCARPQARASITSSFSRAQRIRGASRLGRTCFLPRLTSATRRDRTSTLAAVSRTTSLAATVSRPIRCDSTLGAGRKLDDRGARAC